MAIWTHVGQLYGVEYDPVKHRKALALDTFVRAFKVANGIELPHTLADATYRLMAVENAGTIKVRVVVCAAKPLRGASACHERRC